MTIITSIYQYLILHRLQPPPYKFLLGSPQTSSWFLTKYPNTDKTVPIPSARMDIPIIFLAGSISSSPHLLVLSIKVMLTLLLVTESLEVEIIKSLPSASDLSCSTKHKVWLTCTWPR